MFAPGLLVSHKFRLNRICMSLKSVNLKLSGSVLYLECVCDLKSTSSYFSLKILSSVLMDLNLHSYQRYFSTSKEAIMFHH